MAPKATLIKSKAVSLPTAEYVTITPGQAQLWLDDAARNRKLSQARITKYAAIMERGDWLVTNQGIAFDEYGHLIDGQHRLTAIVKAEVSVTMLVVSAVKGVAQLVMDQGYTRTPHDQIALREGWKVWPIHTATAKAMLKGIGGEGYKKRQEAAKDIQLLNRFYVKHHKAIEFAVESTWAKHGSLYSVIIAPVIAPIARAYYTQETPLLLRFCEVLCTGMSAEGVGSKDTAAVVLRNWLMSVAREKRLNSRTGQDRNILYKKAEVALSAFIKGESIERLGQRTTEIELFPLPNEFPLKKV